MILSLHFKRIEGTVTQDQDRRNMSQKGLFYSMCSSEPAVMQRMCKINHYFSKPADVGGGLYSLQFSQVSFYPPIPLLGHSNLVRQYLKNKKMQ